MKRSEFLYLIRKRFGGLSEMRKISFRAAGICRMIGKRGPRGGFVFIMQKTDGTVTVITLPARKEW